MRENMPSTHGEWIDRGPSVQYGSCEPVVPDDDYADEEPFVTEEDLTLEGIPVLPDDEDIVDPDYDPLWDMDDDDE